MISMCVCDVRCRWKHTQKPTNTIIAIRKHPTKIRECVAAMAAATSNVINVPQNFLSFLQNIFRKRDENKLMTKSQPNTDWHKRMNANAKWEKKSYDWRLLRTTERTVSERYELCARTNEDGVVDNAKLCVQSLVTTGQQSEVKKRTGRKPYAKWWWIKLHRQTSSAIIVIIKWMAIRMVS